MPFIVLIEPEAKRDLRAAFEWYEEQLDGLGHEFIISAKASFSRLERTPGIYRKIFEDFQRAPIRRFPFGIFYLVRSDKIHVLAIYHSKRDPDGWKKRLHRLENK